ncbi:BFD-like [2Fe-2S] binding domain protein [Clostridium argentinense CDC 2741]|uniref:BFD-like [2Fe-2S] binding domain protein n=1 Tax=Clostridium argentinense CDC 2741 TaxID=1418104 RepID=A0A0C1R4J2_9CLOT|nr:(2Fe-2S)-binding protein [Clostridium argentinense]ARC83290.1 (2Fe-2S)-binding protein [Clostridium argentinense]KIE48417.1 BFD-like [2Fe-2S] binding domain protein [Clostridium argentinense CDC 2741]
MTDSNKFVSDEEKKKMVLDKMTKVCICKAIPRSKIKEAIKSGATTVEEVNKIVGSGSGGCKGRRCGPKIEELINMYKNGEF